MGKTKFFFGIGSFLESIPQSRSGIRKDFGIGSESGSGIGFGSGIASGIGIGSRIEIGSEIGSEIRIGLETESVSASR